MSSINRIISDTPLTAAGEKRCQARHQKTAKPYENLGRSIEPAHALNYNQAL
jgi:hypothetical protein